MQDTPDEQPATRNHGVKIYDLEDDVAMMALSCAINDRLDAIIERTVRESRSLPKVGRIYGCLSDADIGRVKVHQSRLLSSLANPGLTAREHHERATKTGRVDAIIGFDQADLTRGNEIMVRAVEHEIDAVAHRRALRVFRMRISQELVIYNEVYEARRNIQNKAATAIARLAVHAESQTALMTGIADILTGVDGVIGSTVTRADRHGHPRFEAIAGETVEQYARTLERSEKFDDATLTCAETPGGLGEAWRTTNIVRIFNVETDSSLAQWLDARSARLSARFRSLVMVPVRRPDGRTHAVVTYYSNFPGAFSGSDSKGFSELIKCLLELALSRLGDLDMDVVPHVMRRRRSALLRSDGLQMYYQPLLDLRTGLVTRVEALARLRDGSVVHAPDEFMSVLSSEDLFELYDRGLDQALAAREAWSAVGFNIEMSVNLPPAAFSNERYLRSTRQRLAQNGTDPAMLTLEILEADEFARGAHAVQAAMNFHALGLKLALDDLGTGHSSLSRLRSLPVDTIKIDRGFVEDVETDAGTVLHFVYQIKRLGHVLGKQVVVEGVESAELLEALALLGVDLAQGYGIARPMPEEQFVPWLVRYPRVPRPERPLGRLGKLAWMLVWKEHQHLYSFPGFPDVIENFTQSAEYRVIQGDSDPVIH